MNLNLSFLIFGIFISLSEGTSTIQVPSAGNCGDDTVLTCQVTGNIGFTGWYGINRDLVANGVAVRPEDNNKYTDSKGTSSFTLTIHNTNITDGGDYKCRNGFDESQLKRLNIECKASSATHSVTSGKEVQITVDKLYPVSPRLTATFKRQKSAIQISGSSACSSSTQYTGYYRCVWTSSNSLDDGSYTYSIVVITITQAAPIKGSFKIASPSTPLISNVVQLNASRKVVYGNEGQSLTIQCTSTGGYPSPTVTWYKNSVSSSNQLSSTSSGTIQSDGTYTVNLQHTFTPATSDDRKYLICRSYYPQADSAQVGSNSKSVLIYLRLKPSQPTVTQTSVVPAGSTVTVRCTTSGCRPAASISWLYQGMTFSGSTTNTADAATETFTVFSTYTRQVTASDNGQSIQCIVTHPALVSPAQLTRSTNLTVQFSAGPSTTQITGNREMIATGSTPLTLTCTTGSSNPASDITWRNGSQTLKSNRPYTTSTGVNNGVVRSQQLILYPTRYMDGDDITCSVSNSVSQSPVVDKIKVNLKYRPLIKPMSDVIVVEGNNTQLKCSASSKPASTFKWYKQGQEHKVFFLLHQGTGTMENNKLSYPLTNVRRGDAATYTCIANNRIENADIKNVRLTVYYPPDVSATTTNTTINAAKVIVTCNAHGVPNSSYTYGKWVQTWPGYNTPITEHSGSERLELTGLTYEHSGIYTCTASNGIKVFGTNQEYMEGSVQLVVKSFPIITNFSKITSSKLMENATVDVYYFSNAAGSNVKIYRNKNGVRLEDVRYNVTETNVQVNLKVFGNTIRTAGVRARILVHIQTKDDTESYDAVVTNEINSTVRSFEIVTKDIPAVPMEFYYFGRCTGVDMFIFHGGSNGGSLQTFVIETQIKGTNIWTEQLRFNETNVRYLQNEQMLYRFDIKGLPPGVYDIRVLAGNNAGWIATDLAPMIEFTVYELEKEQLQQQQSDHKAVIVGGSLSFVIVGILVAGVFIFRKMTYEHADKKTSENRKSSTYDSLHTQQGAGTTYSTLTIGTDRKTSENTESSTYYSLHTQPGAGTTYSTLTIETGSKGAPQDKMYENLKTQSAHDTSQM
ncbi:hemicentin-1-like [Ruditapes philippinarum]|uniref:hemicentin-1-like n=1 Tax=Ruditapes philippinarum TaxID=129788 RepID=UPI00295B2F73|nr:hemicentin-1-like [Ruditapes philippinarum]